MRAYEAPCCHFRCTEGVYRRYELLQGFIRDAGFQAYVEELQGVWDKMAVALPDSHESQGL